MTMRRFSCILATVVAWGAILSHASANDDPRLDYARQLLGSIPEDARPVLKIDPALGYPEGFTTSVPTGEQGSRPTITGGSPAGVLYGAQQWLVSPRAPAGGGGGADFVS